MKEPSEGYCPCGMCRGYIGHYGHGGRFWFGRWLVMFALALLIFVLGFAFGRMSCFSHGIYKNDNIMYRSGRMMQGMPGDFRGNMMYQFSVPVSSTTPVK